MSLHGHAERVINEAVAQTVPRRELHVLSFTGGYIYLEMSDVSVGTLSKGVNVVPDVKRETGWVVVVFSRWSGGEDGSMRPARATVALENGTVVEAVAARVQT